MTRGTYVIRNGELVEKRTGAVASVRSDVIRLPFIVRDLPAYRSPIDGRVIDGRAARREDLKRNNCIAVEPGMYPERGYRNEKLARKFGALPK